MAASTVSQRGTALIPPTHPIKTRKDLPLPHLIPLPPSPPATDAFDIDEAVPDLVPDTRLTRSQSSNHASSNKPKTQSLSRSCSRPDIPAPHSKPFQKRSRDDLDLLSTAPASPISSPLSSPTAQKSSRKRARVANRSSSPSPQPLSNPRDADPFNPRDSPNNPFLVKPGESARRPGTFEKKSSRKLIYVFRGKRIQYDASEDLLDTGDSPFTLSAPKLLFPSSPSPPPRLELIEPSGSNSRPADSFETPRPKRVQNVLPTPQTRSRPGRPATSSASQAGGPIAKAMR